MDAGEAELDGMTMHRINIIGASGCGASTTGRALAAELAIPHFDSDDYFHAHSDPPFQNPRDPETRCLLITADLSPVPSWVLSGGIVEWEPCPQLDFTMVVFLWIPADIRIARLRQREYERFGKRVRAGGDMAAAHEEFIDWAGRYDVGGIEGKTLATHEAFLKQQTCPVLELRGEMPMAEATATIVAALDAD